MLAIKRRRTKSPSTSLDCFKKYTRRQRKFNHRALAVGCTFREESMANTISFTRLDRRTVIRAAAAAGIAQVAAPFVLTARAADEIKIGPQRPADRHLRRTRQKRADRLPIGSRSDQRERRHPRPTSRDYWSRIRRAPIPASRCRRRARLIERDKVDFLLGNVNSAMAVALGDVSSQLKKLHIVTGGHTDAVTGTDCHWNVFRVCNTTRMETNSVSKILVQ